LIAQNSIREHLIGIRIDEVKRLRNFTDETVAASTGFCHAPDFSKTFKRRI